MSNYQSAQRPAASGVVSIADLAMFASSGEPTERTTEEVVEAVRKAWPFEIRSIDEEAGNQVAFEFADGSRAVFSAWK